MTLTEKVDESKHGWEMWVADESLMTTTEYNNARSSKAVIKDLVNKEAVSSNNNSSSSNSNSNNNNNSSSSSNNNKKPINFNNSFNNMKDHSQEGSLTGIGSLANYKPLHPSSSNEQQPQRQPTPQVEPVTQHKPHSPPSTNTLGLVSSHRSDSRKNPPSLSRPSTKGPGIPYAHAYELYGRHVTRVQPPSAHPQPQSGPYPSIPPPEKKAHPPPVAEVCLECMMRDRDMAGVDVLGPGVWARESDADFDEAMLAEAASTIHEQDCPDPSQRALDDSSPKTSNLNAQLIAADPQPRPSKKRIGKGQLLTMPALKAWTLMNPPATAHRWRTLQLYLREQRHYLDLERQAKRSIERENERTEELIRTNADNSLCISTDATSPSNYQFLRAAPSRSKIGYRASSATLLTKGMALETLDVSKDEKAASKHRANENKLRSSTSSKRVSSSPPAHRSRGSRLPRSGAMNINSLSLSTELLNQNDPLPLHSATHPAISSSRAPSPTRFSFVSRKSAGFGESMRPFSSWARARRSGSNSVLSLAPSGSLIDMHVGLSHDRHNNLGSLPSPHGPMSKNRSMLNFHHSGGIPVESQYTHKPSLASLTSSPTTSRFNGLGDPRAANQKKEKKKLRLTLKGLWNKLGINCQRSCSIDQIGSPTPLGIIPNRNRGHVRMGPEDEPLAPPPPLSALAREQQSHRRTRSTLSLSLTSVCRFGSFRPQSVANPNPGLDSTTSSPMSQSFIPPSPGSKLTLNGTGTSAHLSTAYVHSSHNPQFDLLAEELEMVPSHRSSSSASRLKNRARSLGTMSLLSGASGNEETNKQSKCKTIIEPRRSHDGREPENIDENVGPSDLHESQEEGSGVGMITTNGADPITQPKGNQASSSKSTPEKPSSVFTLMSKPSKMLSKLKNRRASFGGSLVLQSNSNNHTSTSINTTTAPTPTTTNGRTDNLRSSISSTQFSTTIPPISDDHPARDSELQNASPRLQQDPNFSQIHHPIDRNDFLPLEKSRHTVSRSNDFLALRYISLGRDDRP